MTLNVPSFTRASTTWSAMPLPMSYWPHQFSMVPKSKSMTATWIRFGLAGVVCAPAVPARPTTAHAAAKPANSLPFIPLLLTLRSSV